MRASENTTIFKFVLTCLVLCSVAPGHAEPAQASGDLLDLPLEQLMDLDVAVASGKNTSIREAPGIVSVVTAEEIRNSGARDLIDVLQMVPGVQLGVDVAGVVSIGIRGLWAHKGKALLIWDGHELNELMYSTIQLGNHYPVDQIERVEIIRGPGSALYGGFAELAVINIITKNYAEGEHSGETTVSYGQMSKTFARRNVNVAFGKKFEELTVNTALFLGEGSRSSKNYEERVKKSRLQELYRVLSDSSPLGIFATDGEGKCTYTNQRYLEITGLTTEDCQGNGWARAVHEEDRERVCSEWQQAALDQSVYNSMHRFVRSDGKITWCSVKASPVFHGAVFDGHVGTLEDITALRATEKRLTLATSAAQIGIWEWDVLTDRLIWEESMFAIYGIKQNDFAGAFEAWSSAVHPADRLECEQELRLALQGVKDFNTIFRIRRPDGCIRFIRASARVEKNGDGEPVRMVGTNLDVTELKASEENLRAILKETANKERLLDFISGIQKKFIEESENCELFDSIVK